MNTAIQVGSKPKYRVIYEKIQSKISRGQYSVGDSLPTHQQLMEKYGVSLGTIRQSLSELEKEGWIKSEQGRGCFVLSRGNHHNGQLQKAALGYAIVCSRLSDPVYLMNLRGATKHLRDNNLNLSLGIFDPNSSEDIQSLIAYVEGLSGVIIGGDLTIDIVRKIPEQSRSKIIFATHILDNNETNGSLTTIIVDAESSGYMAGQMLIMAGHTNIGLLNGSGSRYFADIQRGFERACRDAGIHPPMIFEAAPGASTAEEHAVTEKILKHQELTGIVVTGDHHACRFIQNLDIRGMSVPDDKSVVSIGGLFRDDLAVPNLSRVNVNYELQGEEVAKALLNKEMMSKFMPVKIEAGGTIRRLG